MLKPNYIVIMEIPDIFPYLSTDFANILLSPLSAQILHSLGKQSDSSPKD